VTSCTWQSASITWSVVTGWAGWVKLFVAIYSRYLAAAECVNSHYCAVSNAVIAAHIIACVHYRVASIQFML